MSDISEGYLPFITEEFVSLGERDVTVPDPRGRSPTR